MSAPVEPRGALFEFRVYVRAPDLTWQIWGTRDTREAAVEDLEAARLEHPTETFRLARRSQIEEWLDA